MSCHSHTFLVPAKARALRHPVPSPLPGDLWEGHLQLIHEASLHVKLLFQENLFPLKGGSAEAETLRGCGDDTV